MRYSEFLQSINNDEFIRLTTDHGVRDNINKFLRDGFEFVQILSKTEYGYLFILTQKEDPGDDDFVIVIRMMHVNNLIYGLILKEFREINNI